MKTPLVIVLVIVAAMLGFLTIYSQQSGDVVQAKGPAEPGVAATAPAGGNVPAAPEAAPASTPAPAATSGGK